MSAIAGVVLGGGRSVRMGRPKADLPLGRETLLAHVVRVLAARLCPVVVAAAADQTLPDLSASAVIVRDDVPGGGPALALLNAMRSLPDNVSHAMCVACDAPFVAAGLIDVICAKALSDCAVVPVVAGVRQPHVALYPRAACARLVESPRSLLRLLERLTVVEIPESELRRVDPELAAFRPLNTVAEYEEARLRWQAGADPANEAP